MGFMPQNNRIPGVVVAVIGPLPPEIEQHIPWMHQVNWSRAEDVRRWADHCHQRAVLMKRLGKRPAEQVLRQLQAIAHTIAARIEQLRPYGYPRRRPGSLAPLYRWAPPRLPDVS